MKKLFATISTINLFVLITLLLTIVIFGIAQIFLPYNIFILITISLGVSLVIMFKWVKVQPPDYLSS
ncbi:hypothetical protein ACE1TI_13410 [Alteribacillus sp. JSM 102045]|uniref:hypothetical protein n=1 Tax=Alteribacillus sp. JSM 102045 TaxID=1562101 RepID=UPI0035C1A023